jgi:hypothetical protein
LETNESAAAVIAVGQRANRVFADFIRSIVSRRRVSSVQHILVACRIRVTVIAAFVHTE